MNKQKLLWTFAWLYIVGAVILTFVAFMSFPGWGWGHWAILGSGVLSLVAFLISWYIQRSQRDPFRILDQPPDQIDQATLQDLDDDWNEKTPPRA